MQIGQAAVLLCGSLEKTQFNSIHFILMIELYRHCRKPFFIEVVSNFKFSVGQKFPFDDRLVVAYHHGIKIPRNFAMRC